MVNKICPLLLSHHGHFSRCIPLHSLCISSDTEPWCFSVLLVLIPAIEKNPSLPFCLSLFTEFCFLRLNFPTCSTIWVWVWLLETWNLEVGCFIHLGSWWSVFHFNCKGIWQLSLSLQPYKNMFYRRISVPFIPFLLGGQLQFQAFSDFFSNSGKWIPVNYTLRNSPSKCHWIRYFSFAKIVETRLKIIEIMTE